MPGVPNQETAHEALVRVCNEIDQSGAGGTPDDYAFIKAILQDVVVDAMFQAHDKLNQPMEPADHNAKDTVNYLLDTLDGEARDRNLEELYQILADPDMQAVLMAHDDIARKSFAPVQHPLEPEPVNNTAAAMPDDSPVRYIGITRKPGEPLGITVGNEEDSDGLTVIRIAPDSATDKQGLIRIGDVIAEVNGVPVHTPDDLGDVIGRSGPDIKFKVLPGGIKKTKGGVYQRFLKTHFAYNPHKDNRLSAPSLGLVFEEDDILAVIKDSEKNWWECKNLRTGQTGNVPSPTFEERRNMMSSAPPEKQKSSLFCGLGKKKKKYSINQPTKQDQGPAVLYEEVVKVKPFHHKCLVLVGAQGIGRRSIKNRLIQMMPQDYGAPIPNTSRAMRDGEIDGRNYHFLTREEMESDIKSGKYLEYGELNRNFYGTSFAALRKVSDTGKTCVIDPKSAALSKLRSAEWLPYVVFVKPPSPEAVRRMNSDAINSGVDAPKKTEEEIKRIMDETQRISRQYIHFCDSTITYDSFDSACSKILQKLNQADSTPQWVPASWESKLERIPVTD